MLKYATFVSEVTILSAKFGLGRVTFVESFSLITIELADPKKGNGTKVAFS